MKTTSFYLDDINLERLQRLARMEGRSQGEIVRSAIVAYTQRKPDRHFALEGAWEGDGTSVADISEEELPRGFRI